MKHFQAIFESSLYEVSGTAEHGERSSNSAAGEPAEGFLEDIMASEIFAKFEIAYFDKFG